MSDRTDYDAAFLAGIAQSVARRPVGESGIPYAIVPAGCELKSLEDYLDAPARIRQSVTVSAAESFARYCERFWQPESLLFADLTSMTIEGRLAYHNHEPSWCDHKIQLRLQLTPEWKAWRDADGKAKTQTVFAQFLEDNLPDIAVPDGAALLELVTSLESKKAVTFASSVRLSDGSHELTYQEAVESRGKGTLAIPDRITLGVWPFQGRRSADARAYALDARLRHRITEGKLHFWVDLLRPHKVLEQAFGDVLSEVEKATGQKALLGS